jgi:hypothetical protein
MSAQKRFEEKYITSTQLQAALGITRAALTYGRTRGWLPYPIYIDGGHLTMWEREEVAPYIAAWKKKRDEA